MELELKRPIFLDSDPMKIDHDEDDEVVAKLDDKSPVQNDDSSQTQSLDHKDSTAAKEQDDHDQQLETSKKEMGKVREENQRLKALLAQIVNDYQSLQTQFFDIAKQEESIKLSLSTPSDQAPPSMKTNTDPEEEPELVCLLLGTSSTKINKDNIVIKSKSKESDRIVERGLTLGLDCTKFEPSCLGTKEPVSMNLSPKNSPSDEEEEEEEEAGEPWPPSKVLQSLRSDSGGDDQDVSQQTHAKKARVSVRARCDTPTMNDGCQWRKYGQKIAKGNPCPRAYYRCTIAPSCPVRKQVQRCSEDMSILITTYEGTHNHPLPIAATAMASTTSAATCMLMSGHSAALPGIASPVNSSAASLSSTTLQGLNFNFSGHISRSRNFYLPNPSISSSSSHTTITLDLTAPPSSTDAATYPSQFSRLSSSTYFSSAPRYASTSFNFSSDSNSVSAPSWSSTPFFTYGAQSNHNKNSFFQPLFAQKTSGTATPVTTLSAAPASTKVVQNTLTDTIVKAITSDASFQSALAAAIKSYAGPNGAQGKSSGSAAVPENLIKSLAQSLVNGSCSASLLTRSNLPASKYSEQSNLFSQPSLLLSRSKSTSASPVDNRENTN